MQTYSAATLATTNNLIPYPKMMEELSENENLTRRAISTDGTDLVRFDLEDGFADDFDNLGDNDLLPGAQIRVEGTPYMFTKASFTRALQQAGLRPTYGKKTPGSLLTPHLNYHYSHSTTDADVITLLVRDEHTLVEMVPNTRQVFSTYQVVDTVAGAAARHFGISTDSLFFDYKYQNRLDRAVLRLIIPDTQKTIKTSRHGAQQQDIWSTGVMIQNTMTGEVQMPLSLVGYLFAWWCTNGSTTTRAHSEKYSKRELGDDWGLVSEWLTDSTINTLEVLPDELNKVEQLTQMDLTGELGSTAQQVLRSFKIPAGAMDQVRDFLVEGDDLSGYGLMQAITQAANDPEMDESKRARIMDAGGAVAHSLVDRCNACHRVTF